MEVWRHQSFGGRDVLEDTRLTVFCFASSIPDGSATRSRVNFKQITYWDAYDGTAIRVIEGGEEEMNTLDVEPSGELFVSGGDDGLVKVCI